jgi:hypothetical protein
MERWALAIRTGDKRAMQRWDAMKRAAGGAGRGGGRGTVGRAALSDEQAHGSCEPRDSPNSVTLLRVDRTCLAGMQRHQHGRVCA